MNNEESIFDKLKWTPEECITRAPKEQPVEFPEAMEINERIKDLLKEASYDERERIWTLIHEGLCLFCGGDEPCYCRRDD